LLTVATKELAVFRYPVNSIIELIRHKGPSAEVVYYAHFVDLGHQLSKGTLSDLKSDIGS